MATQAVGIDDSPGAGGESKRCRVIPKGFVPEIVETGPGFVEKPRHHIGIRHMTFGAGKLFVMRCVPGRSDVDHTMARKTDLRAGRHVVGLNEKGHDDGTGNDADDNEEPPIHK